MNILRNLLYLCLLVTANVSAQGFLRTYVPPSSSLQEVQQTADGGYFAVGKVSIGNNVLLLRTDAVGQTIWSNQLPLSGARGIATCMALDGDFIVLADQYQDNGVQKNVVLKVGQAGNVVWQTVVESNNFPNGLRDIVTLPDGSFIATGNTYGSFLAVKNQLVKIAPDGSILWQKQFGTNARNIRRLVLMPDGNLAVAGVGEDLYLAQLTPDGNLLWEQNYPEQETQKCYDLVITADGNLAVLATSPVHLASGADQLHISILKTDTDGNKIWHKHFFPFPNGSTKLPILNTFAQDNTGNFYIPFWGFLDDPLDSDLKILKLDPDGNALAEFTPQVSANAFHIIPTADHQFVIAGDNNGFPTNALLLKVDSDGAFLGNRITGNVFRDNDSDCAWGSGEPGAGHFIVKAENQAGETFFKKVNPDGSYEVRVSKGAFDLSVRRSYGPTNAYFVCDTPTVTLLDTLQTVEASPIGIQMLADCPLLEVQISGGILRRCRTTVYSVNWGNAGNTIAENVTLQITVDTLLNYVSSTLPLSSQNGHIYNFNLGDIPPDTYGTMNIVFQVSCLAVTDEVLCAEAHIFPEPNCPLTDPNLDGSKIEVTGSCNGAEIEFKIKNTGLGDMTEMADYVIIEDEIMYAQPPFQLPAGEEMTSVRVPMPEDSCFALRVFPNQHSILSKPLAVVANCIADGNLSLLLSLPNNENDLAIDSHCGAVLASCDPNDKIGLPLGLTNHHYLERGDDIEYTLRFQNTGNDTAFLVVLRDTLPASLDPISIRPIGASHNYTWDVTDGGILTFTFANILLPDSTTNEPASRGFVSFRIAQKPNLPDGTLIQNNASIYFDFNDPVLTNTWQHTIGRPAMVAIKEPGTGLLYTEVLITPNPMAEEARFELQGYMPDKPLRFALLDPLGKLLREEGFAGNEFLLRKQNLPSGIYFWQIKEGNKTLARGRVVVE